MKMGDGGLRPAYNLQFATDCASRVIVGVDAVSAGSDMAQIDAVAQWRKRMATGAARAIYKDRAATAECVNAQARCVVRLYALAHNLTRMAALAPQLIGLGTTPPAMAASSV